MTAEALIGRFGILAATFALSVVSAVVPVVVVEVFLLAAAAFTSPLVMLEVVAVAAIGQMLPKCVFYFAGRGSLTLPLGRYRERFDEWSVRLGRSRRGVDVVMFSSALWGVPPFTVVPYLAGAFRLSFARFLVWGLLGRFLRFAAVAVLPVLINLLT